MNSRKFQNAFPVLTGLFVLAILLSANNSSLGFADGAEFALVVKLRSIAHPPGFPSYILLSSLLSQIFKNLTNDFVVNLIYVSILYSVFASIYTFKTFTVILQKIFNKENDLIISCISLGSTISIFSGVTIWHWSTMVEVYSFQLLCFAGLVYHLFIFTNFNKNYHLILASLYLAFALSNHHLTMILFLPFVPLFFFTNLLKSPETFTKSKKITKQTQSLFSILKSKPFLKLFAFTSLFTFLLYGWMFFRAADDIVFKFGNPDSASRLWYHLTGGAWINNTKKVVSGIYIKRLPYFLYLIKTQFSFNLFFIFTGLIATIQLRKIKLLVISVLYFSLILIYQLRIDQYSDTDAYMIFPFYILSLLLPIGIYWVYQKFYMTIFIFLFLVPIQLILSYEKVEAKNFNVSQNLMKVLDYSLPKNAVVLVSDWTIVSQFYYYQTIENFRPDVIMLNYDLKFCNYKIFKSKYPRFYKIIQKTYDKFIADLGEKHPQDIYNTGCNLDSDELLHSYANCISDIIQKSKTIHRTVLYDPKTFVFLTQYKIIQPDAYVSGSLVSSEKSLIGKQFLTLEGLNFLNSELMLYEPASADKLIDILTMMEFNKNYYTAYHDTSAVSKTENSLVLLTDLKRKMKKNMPFLFNRKDY